MPANINRATLDADCKYSKEQFSRKKRADSLQKHAIPSPVKRPTARTPAASSWYQSLSNSPYVAYGENPDVIARKDCLSKKEVEYYSTAEGIVDLNKRGIAMAVERRVALFFQQSMLCHKMPLTFLQGGHADEQYGSAPVLTLRTADGKYSVKHKREAAHSSTNPKIYAVAADGTKFTYFNGTSFIGSYKAQQNQTIGMHIDVNHVDSWIDGAGCLREKAIALLNRTTKGLSPIKATRLFIKCFIEVNKQNIQRLEGEEGVAEETKRRVSQSYIRHAKEILAASEDSKFFEQLTGGLIEAQDCDDDEMRSAILKKRFKLILLQESIECRIAKRIETARIKIEGQEKFFEHALLKIFAKDDDRMVVEKLLAKSASPFDEGFIPDGKTTPQASYKTFLTNVNKFTQKNSAVLATLVEEMKKDFRKLNAAEYTFRSVLFWQMRKMVKNWTAEEFCKKYKKETGRSISNSWVSRIEELAHSKTHKVDYKTPLNQRRKYVTEVEAKDFAKIFGVSQRVFLPCLITSR